MKIAKKNSYIPVLLTALLSAGSILFLLRTFFLEDYYFLSYGTMSDLIRANLPTYYQLYDNLASGGGFWTWHIGIGASMFTHADVVMDPFTYIAFLGGREHIPDMFVWVPVCKTVCAAIAAYLYLSWFKFDWRICVMCANLYAISGIQIFSNNFALGTVCVYCPLFLLGIEHLLVRRGWKLALLSLLVTCLYSYYFFYISGLLCALYLAVRLPMTGVRSARQFFLPLLTLALFGILCVGLSAFILLPQVELASNSVRTTTAKDVELSLELLLPDLKCLFSALARTFQLNLLGDSVNTYYLGKFNDYFQFTTYITGAAVPLLVQFWMGAQKKARIWFCVIAVVCLAAISIPLFAFVMNSFSTINYRWMFIINLLLALGCALGIQAVVDHGGFYRVPLYLGIVGGLGLSIVCTCLLRKEAGDLNLFYGKKTWLSVVLVMGLLVLLDLYIASRKPKPLPLKALAGAICTVMLVEAGLNYYPWYHDEPVLHGIHTNEAIYDGADAQIVKDLMTEDTGFYRIHKNFDPVVTASGIESMSDAMAQGYYGLKAYCSLNNAQYVGFITSMDLACYPLSSLQQEYEARIFRIQPLENGYYLILNLQGKTLSWNSVQNEVSFIDLDSDDLDQQWMIRRDSQSDTIAVTIAPAESASPMALSIQDRDDRLALSVEHLSGQDPTVFALSPLGWSALNEGPFDAEVRDGYYKISPLEDDRLFVTCQDNGLVKLDAAAKSPADLSGADLNYTSGVYDHYDLMSYLGVKYYISQGEADALPDYFSLLREECGYYIYQNTACFPLAFVTGQVVSEEDFMTLYGSGKESMLLNATVVRDSNTILDGELQDLPSLAQTRQEAFSLVSFSSDHVEFSLQVPENAQYLNLSIPYDKDWQIEIDGEKISTERVNIGLLGVKLNNEQKNRTIYVCMKYVPRSFYTGLAVSILTCIALVAVFLWRKRNNKMREFASSIGS